MIWLWSQRIYCWYLGVCCFSLLYIARRKEAKYGVYNHDCAMINVTCKEEECWSPWQWCWDSVKQSRRMVRQWSPWQWWAKQRNVEAVKSVINMIELTWSYWNKIKEDSRTGHPKVEHIKHWWIDGDERRAIKTKIYRRFGGVGASLSVGAGRRFRGVDASLSVGADKKLRVLGHACQVLLT